MNTFNNTSLQRKDTHDVTTFFGASNDVMSDAWLRAIFIFLYSAIFLLGISGNSVVVYVVLRNPTMQTITNVFIMNLAVSDIMMCLLAVPFTPLSGLLKSWVFGEVLCHVVPMSLSVSVFVSTLTSMAIAVDRYSVIVHPFHPRIQTVCCLLLIVAIWAVSVIISLPLAIYQKVSWDPVGEVFLCHELWPTITGRRFFTCITLVLQYIVPCSVITFCYCRVSLALGFRSLQQPSLGLARTNRDRLRREVQRKRRTNSMLIAMVSIFVCCWLPLNVVHLATEYLEDDDLGRWEYFLLLFFVAHVIAMSSTVYNPFLYAWMNDNFRKEFRRIVPCLLDRAPTGQLQGDNSDRRTTATGGESTQLTTLELAKVATKTPQAIAKRCKQSERRRRLAMVVYRANSQKVILIPTRKSANNLAGSQP